MRDSPIRCDSRTIATDSKSLTLVIPNPRNVPAFAPHCFASAVCSRKNGRGMQMAKESGCNGKA